MEPLGHHQNARPSSEVGYFDNQQRRPGFGNLEGFYTVAGQRRILTDFAPLLAITWNTKTGHTK